MWRQHELPSASTACALPAGAAAVLAGPAAPGCRRGLSGLDMRDAVASERVSEAWHTGSSGRSEMLIGPWTVMPPRHWSSRSRRTPSTKVAAARISATRCGGID